MIQFVVEVYQGTEWTPIVIWPGAKDIRAALFKLGNYCKQNNRNLDSHRIKILKTQDEIIDAKQRIKKERHG